MRVPVLLLIVAGCAGTRPTAIERYFDDGPAVLVKSVRLPDSEPWLARFSSHTFFDLRTRTGGPWMRLEVLSRTSGVRVVPLEPDEVFADRRWDRRVEVLASRTGAGAAPMARKLLDLGIAQNQRYLSSYRAWPGPNSNTFAEGLLREVDGLGARLDHNAVGKDWAVPVRVGLTGSGAGVELETPIFGLELGVVEGVQAHILGAAFGIGIVPPALQLPFLPPLRLATRAQVGVSAAGDVSFETPR